MEYNDLVDDLILQKEMHEDVKVLIQCVFGFSYCFVKGSWNASIQHYEPYNVFERLVHLNVDDRYNINLHKQHSFVDIVIPETEQDVEFLHNAIKENLNNEQLLANLRHCEWDRYFEKLVKNRLW